MAEKDKQISILESYFEKLLWSSRHMVLAAVVSSMLLSVLLFFLTAFDVGTLISHAPDYLSAPAESKKALKAEMVAHTVGSIDGFLLATILLIFSLGLYELFIRDIEVAKESKQQSSKVLIINSLDDLKAKLANVILMILVVTFFEVSLSMSFTSSLDLLYFALGILLVALALYFGSKSKLKLKD